MELKGAILIIGSLLWDPNQNSLIGFRKKWRNKRLQMDNRIHVKAPIRYGRESGNGKNLTMVFSSDCDNKTKFGTAFLVPVKNAKIKSVRGIVNQARFLSEAEGSANKKLCKGNNDKWCTIGILFNPKLKKNLKEDILKRWRELILKDDGLKDFTDYKVGNEKSALSNKGEILIKWIKSIDKDCQTRINEFDFILATCTKPNVKQYPNSEEIANDIINDNRKYFFNNLINGITTFQDKVVLKSNTSQPHA